MNIFISNNLGVTKDDIKKPVLYNCNVIGYIQDVNDYFVKLLIFDKYLSMYPFYDLTNRVTSISFEIKGGNKDVK